MIYIDPPYNTGSDSFVYPDDYTERKADYEQRAGITDEHGFEQTGLVEEKHQRKRTIPQRVAKHDVPAPLSGEKPAAGRRRDVCFD